MPVTVVCAAQCRLQPSPAEAHAALSHCADAPADLAGAEVLPLLCPKSGGEMTIIAFVTEAVVDREILGYPDDR
ncbi:MAG: hypothetical protein V3T18_08610 [Pseudomonadales bacterium]